MSRFRKWLIHKLGGYTKEDMIKYAYNQPIKYEVENIKLETITAVHHLDDHIALNYAQDDVESFLKDILLKELLKYLKPEYSSIEDGIKIKYIAKIKLPSQYVKGVENDD